MIVAEKVQGVCTDTSLKGSSIERLPSGGLSPYLMITNIKQYNFFKTNYQNACICQLVFVDCNILVNQTKIIMTLKEKLNLLPPSYGDYALNISSEFNDGVLTWIIGYEGNYGWLQIDGSTFLFSGADIELVVDDVFRAIHYYIIK